MALDALVASKSMQKRLAERDQSLADLAREFLQESGGDLEKAERRLLARVNGDSELRAEAVAWAVRNMLLHTTYEQRAHIARVISGNVNPGARVRTAMNSNFLTDWWVGAKPLGKCTPDDLREDISARKAEAATHLKRAKFMTSVLKGMKPGKTVEQCYSEEKLAEIAKADLA